MTTYDRMRAAAARLSYLEAQEGDGYCELAYELHADADRLEAVEREIRICDPTILDRDGCECIADSIRGEGK